MRKILLFFVLTFVMPICVHANTIHSIDIDVYIDEFTSKSISTARTSRTARERSDYSSSYSSGGGGFSSGGGGGGSFGGGGGGSR